MERKTAAEKKREALERRELVKEVLAPYRQLENETQEEYLTRIRKELNGTKVMSCIIQKGGCGKTTTSSNLALSLANMGFDVLLIDSDSQASLTVLVNEFDEDSAFEGKEEDEVTGLADLYEEYINYGTVKNETISKVIVRPTYKVYESHKETDPETGKRVLVRDSKEVEFGFDFIAGDISLADAEIFLATRTGNTGGMALTSIIDGIKGYKQYDFIIIDCPPGLGFLSYNAIAASTAGIIIPLNLEIMAITGCKNLIGMTADIQHLIKNRYNVDHYGELGIVINEYVPRSKRQRSLSEVVDKFMPVEKFETSIPSKEACDTAHYFGRLYQQDCEEAKEAFDLLATEIIARIIRNNTREPRIIEESDLGTESDYRLSDYEMDEREDN